MEMPEQAASPKLNQLLLKYNIGRLSMTIIGLIVAIISCVGTLVCAVIGILAYLKDKKE